MSVITLLLASSLKRTLYNAGITGVLFYSSTRSKYKLDVSKEESRTLLLLVNQESQYADNPGFSNLDDKTQPVLAQRGKWNFKYDFFFPVHSNAFAGFESEAFINRKQMNGMLKWRNML